MFSKRDNEMDAAGYVPMPFALALCAVCFVLGVIVGMVAMLPTVVFR